MIFRNLLRLRPLSFLRRQTYFCSHLIPSAKLHEANPYYHYPKDQLLYLAKSGELSVNELILLSQALKRHKYYDKNVYAFITKHLRNTNDAMFGTFLEIFHTADNIPQSFLRYYIEEYVEWNRNYNEELKITQILSDRVRKWKDEHEEYFHAKAKEMNSKKIVHGYFRAGVLDIKGLIAFTRFFKDKVDKTELTRQFSQKNSENLHNQEKILLAYLTQDLDLKIPQQYSLVTSDPKSICLLCELHNKATQSELNALLSSISFDEQWTYQTIVWISQYLPPRQLQQAHKYLISNCKLEDTSSLMIYVRRLPQNLQPSLCSWLCNQQSYLYETFLPKDLINILQYLPTQSFGPYLEMLMKEARGNYPWEEVNKLYYYARLWNIQSEHTDTLRIYVVNGYLSLGVHRRQIPTTSYFYKIIEMVPPEELYKFKINF